jgi:hypothetical protein
MRQVHQISPTRAADFLRDETQGRIFSVYFQKADGSMRQMTCRRGVKRHLRGGSLPYDPNAKNLLPVFDLERGEYRTVPLARLVSFNVSGATYILAA